MTTTDPNATDPSIFVMGPAERQTIRFDMTDDLAQYGDQTVTEVTVTMTNVDTSAMVTLTYSPTVTSPWVDQTVDAVADGLSAGSSYTLQVEFTAYPSLNRFTPYVTVNITP